MGIYKANINMEIDGNEADIKKFIDEKRPTKGLLGMNEYRITSRSD